MKNDYSEPVTIHGEVPMIFNQYAISQIGRAVNYNARVLEAALDRIEQLENTAFKKGDKE